MMQLILKHRVRIAMAIVLDNRNSNKMFWLLMKLGLRNWIFGKSGKYPVCDVQQIASFGLFYRFH